MISFFKQKVVLNFMTDKYKSCDIMVMPNKM